jgi:hypothetical protein
MAFSSSKSLTTLTALFLMFAMTFSLVTIPSANAQGTKKTYAFIGAVPNPVGVGQEVLLHVGITDPLANEALGWEGLTVTVTRPDGKTETLGPFRTDATGGTGTVYVPTMAGNYTLQTHFPEQLNPASTVAEYGTPEKAANVTMLASDSEKLTLIVQEEPVSYYPSLPLPTEYWTRPIDAQQREWAAVSGNWLEAYPNIPDNHFAPYNEGPETAHILWAKPLTTGGLAGGALDGDSFSTGDAYEGFWSGSIILAGKLYYQTGGSAGLKPVVFHCVDLHTGEELWAKTFLDNRTIAFGQLFYWDAWNMHAVFPYLWVTVGRTWEAFDAFTGDWRYTVTNVPSGTTLFDSNDGIYRLQVNLAKGWMALWNETACCALEGSQGNTQALGSWGNTVQMHTFDAEANTTWAKSAWSWNVTIPTDLSGRVYAQFFGDRIIGADISTTAVDVWGLNLNESKGTIGQVMFDKTWNAPAEWAAGNLTASWAASSLEDKVAVLWIKDTRQYYGFSLETGAYLWGPTESENYLDIYNVPLAKYGYHDIAYGKLYSTGVGGILYCYDVTTGELLWTYEATDPYQEYLFANNWWLDTCFITDGKIYLGHEEHSPINPLPRGAPFICLNATTGDEIFRANGLFRQNHWGGRAIIGDSIIAGIDTYDLNVYAIGKGPSATTVTAAPEVSVYGSSVLVKGMVTDVSPGTNDAALTMRFPNGVPAVSDANMSDWMMYVYKQFPRPADVVGVDVVVSVLDPNNNVYEVGKATSDASGVYGVAFTPQVPGKYTVIASFEGSGAYYGSFAETVINVEEAPAATPGPTPTPASMTDAYVLGIGAGAIIAIVVIGLVIILMLRKR